MSIFEGEAAKLVDGVVDGVTGTLRLRPDRRGQDLHRARKGRHGQWPCTTTAVWCRGAWLRLFATAMKKRRSGRVVDVRLSVCEVYNEREPWSLLRPPPEKGQPVGLPVVERNGLTEIKGLEKAPVASAADALRCCMMRD